MEDEMKLIIDPNDISPEDAFYVPTQEQLDWFEHASGSALDEVPTSSREYREKIVKDILMHEMVDACPEESALTDGFISVVMASELCTEPTREWQDGKTFGHKGENRAHDEPRLKMNVDWVDFYFAIHDRVAEGGAGSGRISIELCLVHDGVDYLLWDDGITPKGECAWSQIELLADDIDALVGGRTDSINLMTAVEQNVAFRFVPADTPCPRFKLPTRYSNDSTCQSPVIQVFANLVHGCRSRTATTSV